MNNPNKHSGYIDTRELLPPPCELRIYNIFRNPVSERLAGHAQESLEQLWVQYGQPVTSTVQRPQPQFLTAFDRFCMVPGRAQVAVNRTLEIFGKDPRFGIKDDAKSTFIFTDYPLQPSSVFNPIEPVKVGADDRVAIVSFAAVEADTMQEFAARFLARRAWGELHGLPTGVTVDQKSDVGDFFDRSCTSAGCLMRQVQHPSQMVGLFKGAFTSKGRFLPSQAEYKTGFCSPCDKRLAKTYEIRR